MDELFVARRGTGIPLLLVHGFPLDHQMWRFQLNELARECEVLAPDLPGFGRSQPPLDTDSGEPADTVSMEDYADHLARTLDLCCPSSKVVFCGLSMGGYIAWQFYRKYAARLAGIVLCDTRAAADSEATARGRRIMASEVLSDGSASVADSMVEKLFAASTAEKSPERLAEVGRVIAATDPSSIAAAQRGMADRPDMTALLPEVDCPALVICGREDVITPLDEMEEMAGQLPQSQFVVIEGAGHLAPLERPAAVNRAIAGFLQQILPS